MRIMMDDIRGYYCANELAKILTRHYYTIKIEQQQTKDPMKSKVL